MYMYHNYEWIHKQSCFINSPLESRNMHLLLQKERENKKYNYESELKIRRYIISTKLPFIWAFLRLTRRDWGTRPLLLPSANIEKVGIHNTVSGINYNTKTCRYVWWMCTLFLYLEFCRERRECWNWKENHVWACFFRVCTWMFWCKQIQLTKITTT